MTLLPSHLLGDHDDPTPDRCHHDRCHHDPVLLILLFDNSPSVGTRNDPAGHRFAEAAAALARWQERSAGERHLVALCTFDSEGGPLPLDGSEWRPMLTQLARAEDTSSRLRPSLHHAERLARAHPGRRVVLVVLSDFELLDDVLWLVLRRLRRFPGRVHAVVLTAEPPRQLLEGPLTVSRITSDSRPGDLARAVVAAVEVQR